MRVGDDLPLEMLSDEASLAEIMRSPLSLPGAKSLSLMDAAVGLLSESALHVAYQVVSLIKFNMDICRKVLRHLLVAIFVITLCAGCLISPRPYPNPNNPISRVAVLPLHNKTENVTGCGFVRHAFIDMVRAHYYSVMPPAETDQILQDKFGITLGGQLDLSNPAVGAPSPQSVGEALGVDGVFYGTLEEFNHIYLMYYEDKQVEVTFSLINSKTGLTVWTKEAQASNAYSLNKLFNPSAQGLSGMIISRALGQNPLKEETDEVMRKLGETLPCGPGYVGR